MQLRRLMQKIHRWLALLLGVQVVIWMASGVIMSWFHISLVRGEVHSTVAFSPELEARSYASPGGAIAQMEGVTEVRLKSFLARPVYEVTGANGVALFSAETGAKISPISEEQAREIAKSDFSGDDEIIDVERLLEPPHEYRGAKPVWRVSFGDGLDTRLYISPNTGEVSARRNKVWRLYDFFWMLHIMDYGEREDFNNPLIRAASATGFLFALSGAFLVISRVRNGRYMDDFGKKEDRRSSGR